MTHTEKAKRIKRSTSKSIHYVFNNLPKRLRLSAIFFLESYSSLILRERHPPISRDIRQGGVFNNLHFLVYYCAACPQLSLARLFTKSSINRSVFVSVSVGLYKTALKLANERDYIKLSVDFFVLLKSCLKTWRLAIDLYCFK